MRHHTCSSSSRTCVRGPCVTQEALSRHPRALPLNCCRSLPAAVSRLPSSLFVSAASWENWCASASSSLLSVSFSSGCFLVLVRSLAAPSSLLSPGLCHWLCSFSSMRLLGDPLPVNQLSAPVAQEASEFCGCLLGLQLLLSYKHQTSAERSVRTSALGHQK